MARHRILVADDHVQVRRLVTDLLGSEFEIVGTAADGLSALEAAARLHPDLVVLDISMPAVNGLEAAAQMLEWPAPPRVVFLTVHADRQIVGAARMAGASGYVLKRTMAVDLLPAVHSALDAKTPAAFDPRAWPKEY